MVALFVAGAVYWAKGRLDRAADADRIELQAAHDVADAKAHLELATAQIKADREAIAEAETARATADEIIRKREDANASLLDLLRARARALAPASVACVYGNGTQRLLLDAQRGVAAPEAAALPNATGPAH